MEPGCFTSRIGTILILPTAQRRIPCRIFNSMEWLSNRIFARWLQKRVVITDSSGVQYFAQGGYGPDRQWFHAPTSGTLEGTMVVYAEDGLTPLGSSFVNLTSGKAYTLVLH